MQTQSQTKSHRTNRDYRYDDLNSDYHDISQGRGGCGSKLKGAVESKYSSIKGIGQRNYRFPKGAGSNLRQETGSNHCHDSNNSSSWGHGSHHAFSSNGGAPIQPSVHERKGYLTNRGEYPRAQFG
mmetsp:Transcript_3798/g.6478  ORF Transcript_3798/g.6478 Transcript_3798/m.6478 type:complete len:126 (-) Transcript_3798:553-930(-)